MNTEQKKPYKPKQRVRREMTYDEMDAMCERFAQLEFQCGEWWPTIQEIQERIEPKLKANLEFIIWITETACEPRNEEEVASRKYLLQLIQQSVRVVEERKAKEDVQ